MSCIGLFYRSLLISYRSLLTRDIYQQTCLRWFTSRTSGIGANRECRGAWSGGVLLWVVYRSLLQVSIRIVHVSFDTSLLAYWADLSYRRDYRLSRGLQWRNFIMFLCLLVSFSGLFSYRTGLFCYRTGLFWHVFFDMWGGPQVWAPIETVEGLPVERPGGYPQKSATHVKRDQYNIKRDMWKRHIYKTQLERLPVEGPGRYPQKSATFVKRDVKRDLYCIKNLQKRPIHDTQLEGLPAEVPGRYPQKSATRLSKETCQKRPVLYISKETCTRDWYTGRYSRGFQERGQVDILKSLPHVSKHDVSKETCTVSKETCTISKETCKRDWYTGHYSRGFQERGQVDILKRKKERKTERKKERKTERKKERNKERNKERYP